MQTTDPQNRRRRRSRKAEPRLTGAELLAEVQWLLDGGVHPLLAADELHRTPASIETAARRLGNADLARLYYPFTQSARRSAS